MQTTSLKQTVNGVVYKGLAWRLGERPLLMLHGFTGSGKNWEPLAQNLSGVYCIAPDLLGHGRTEAPQDPDRYKMEQAAVDLVDLLDMLGLASVDLLGYSMGGRLALYVALTYPERVRRLILESSSPGLAGEDERIGREQRDNALAERIEREGIPAFVDFWESLGLWESQKQLVPEKRAGLREQRLENRPLGLANSLRGMGTGVQPNLWPRLAELKMSVLLLTGEHDGKFIGIAQEMMAQLPDARHQIVPDAGHTVHFEQSEAWCTAVSDFLVSTKTKA